MRKTAVNRSAGLNETNERPVLGSEVPPALEAATLDHGAPGTGAHARAKAVLALASSHVGLVGTLHGEVSPIGGRDATGRILDAGILRRSAPYRPPREENAKSEDEPRNPGVDRETSQQPIRGRFEGQTAVCHFLPASLAFAVKGFSAFVAHHRRATPTVFPLLPVAADRPYTRRRSRTAIRTSPERVPAAAPSRERAGPRICWFFHTLWTGVWTGY